MIQALVTAEALGILVDRIEVRLGDTILPPGPLSGASRETGSVIPAVLQASKEAIKAVLRSAASQTATLFHGAQGSDLMFEKGSVQSQQDSSALNACEDAVQGSPIVTVIVLSFWRQTAALLVAVARR